jgi:hypothetical protein
VAGLLLFPLTWKIHALLALALAVLPPLVELGFVLTDPNGRRLGDRIAGTKVLD